jgi:hypothetical protein
MLAAKNWHGESTCVVVLFVPVYSAALLLLVLLVLLMMASEELIEDIELCRNEGSGCNDE